MIADERAEVESIHRMAQAMALFMAEWCGLGARGRETVPAADR